MLDLAHAARERKFPAIFEQDDMFATTRRRLHGLDAIQVYNH